MTSQKRYRHHQDNSGARFRDLPPRFKRQKSSSSPPRPQSPPDTHKGSLGNDTTHREKADTPPSNTVMVPTTSAPNSSHMYQAEETITGHIRSGTDILQTPQTVMSNPTTWKWPQMTASADSAFLSSPWDSTYHTMDFQQPTHISLGTHFGYKANSSPLSPWASGGATNFSELHGAVGSPIWTSETVTSYAGQRINSSPGYFGSDEKWATSQHFIPYLSPGAMWSIPVSSSEHYPNSSSPPVKSSTSNLPAKINEQVNYYTEAGKSDKKRAVDYSDPDIRTIEMLRELERVADQKDSENDGFGSDRKSLVSHHLRMLMCAVDRYTEGVEDELSVISRHDEVTPSSSDSRGSTPGVSPDPCKSWVQDKASDVTGSKKELDISQWSPSNNMPSVWNDPISPAKSCTEVSDQRHESSYMASSQIFPILGEQKVTGGQGIAAWDLWSSPTFDFCGVLMNQSSEDSMVKDETQRKPLYQRQLQHF